MVRVLIVDDSEELLGLFSHFLTAKRYTVATAISKKTLLNKVANFSPDIILLDIRLGDTDGRTICRELKGTFETAMIPVILLSANPLLLEDYKECLADEIIEKPFDIASVVQKIERTLSLGVYRH